MCCSISFKGFDDLMIAILSNNQGTVLLLPVVLLCAQRRFTHRRGA
jgi:hypothetical protein